MSPHPPPVPASPPALPSPLGEPVVAVVMGSDSDWSVMRDAAEALTEFGIPHEVRVLSAHRTPQRMLDWAGAAAGRGLRVVVAGAGGAAHLPGMLAAATVLPVIGVPVPLARLDGLDSLLSIVQMPAGVPVATVGIGAARNAGLLAVRVLATADPALAAAITDFQQGLADLVTAKDEALAASLTRAGGTAPDTAASTAPDIAASTAPDTAASTAPAGSR